MNRYFWLLLRFVGDDSTLPDRRGIYDRARQALELQLYSADPPLSDAQLSFERLSFEEAIRSIESCIARWGVTTAAGSGAT